MHLTKQQNPCLRTVFCYWSTFIRMHRHKCLFCLFSRQRMEEIKSRNKKLYRINSSFGTKRWVCDLHHGRVRTGMEKEGGSRLHTTKAAKPPVKFLSQNLFASDDARNLTGTVTDKKKIIYCSVLWIHLLQKSLKQNTSHSNINFSDCNNNSIRKVWSRTKNWKGFYHFPKTGRVALSDMKSA